MNDADMVIELPGKPVAKARPRFSKVKGQARTYDKQSEEKNTDKWRLKARMLGQVPFTGPLAVKMHFVYDVPKTHKGEGLAHTSKPDLDNLIKWVGDVGNGILWYDDSQITELVASKGYGKHPKTVIEIKQLGGGHA